MWARERRAVGLGRCGSAARAAAWLLKVTSVTLRFVDRVKVGAGWLRRAFGSARSSLERLRCGFGSGQEASVRPGGAGRPWRGRLRCGRSEGLRRGGSTGSVGSRGVTGERRGAGPASWWLAVRMTSIGAGVRGHCGPAAPRLVHRSSVVRSKSRDPGALE